MKSQGLDGGTATSVSEHASKTKPELVAMCLGTASQAEASLRIEGCRWGSLFYFDPRLDQTEPKPKMGTPGEALTGVCWRRGRAVARCHVL